MTYSNNGRVAANKQHMSLISDLAALKLKTSVAAFKMLRMQKSTEERKKHLNLPKK